MRQRSTDVRRFSSTMYIKNRRNSNKFRAFGSLQSLCLTENLVLRNRLLFIYSPLAIIKKTQKPINKRDMKKIINCLILIATITLISCEEVPDTPTNFIASQGTYIGVVHLAYGELDGDAVVYRFNEENANWEEISWTSSSNFDDNGHDLPAPYLIPGKEYRYKMRVHSDGYSSYTNEITGYAFKGEPAEITSINRENNGNNTQYT